MKTVRSEHRRRFTEEQLCRLSRDVLPVCRGANHLLAFSDEQDRLLIRRADGYYADEFGFVYDALECVETGPDGVETVTPLNRVITVKQPIA